MRCLIGELLDHVLQERETREVSHNPVFDGGEAALATGRQERGGHTLRPLGLAPAMVLTVAPDL